MNRIGIIGFGNMGFTICESIKKDFSVVAFDKDKSKTASAKALKIDVAESIEKLVNDSEVVILAIKPQDFRELLDEIKEVPGINSKLVVSIAAGIKTRDIESILNDVRVIRVMPNIAAKVRKGMSCLSKGQKATDEDLKFTKDLFEHLGETLVLKEAMMDEATAISGSGSGYFCQLLEINNLTKIEDYKKYTKVFIPELINAAENIGFSQGQANLLVKQTADGAIALLEDGLTPEELKKQVSSKGGTTEAAINTLKSGGSLKEAVVAAVNRAKELSGR